LVKAVSSLAIRSSATTVDVVVCPKALMARMKVDRGREKATSFFCRGLIQESPLDFEWGVAARRMPQTISEKSGVFLTK
jgi:hypothetical protein